MSEYVDDIAVFSDKALKFQLYPPQAAILRAFYQQTTEEDREILERWKKTKMNNWHKTMTNWEEGNIYEELVLVCGMGGGKSELSTIIASFETTKLLLMDDPAAHFGLSPGSELFVLLVAVSREQGFDTLFSKLKNKIIGHPWFSALYHLPRRSKHEESKGHRFNFPDKNIVIFTGTSSSSGMVGRNVAVVIFDELARYQAQGTELAADGKVVQKILLYDTLTKSVQRLKGMGKKISIASPLAINDPIMELVRSAPSAPSRLWFHLPTWEINPTQKLECRKHHPRVQVKCQCGVTTRDIELPTSKLGICKQWRKPWDFGCVFCRGSNSLQSQMKANPESFMRDYGAQPSLTVQPLYEDPQHIDECVSDRKEPIDWHSGWKTTFVGDPKFDYVMALDTGLKHDAFAICICHWDGEIEKVVMDMCKRFLPKDNNEVDLDKIYLFMETVLGNFPTCQTILTDRWNAAYMNQKFAKLGYNVVERHATLNVEHGKLKELFYLKKMDIYQHDHLIEELKRLELINGKRIDHSPDFFKDCADALARAAVWASENSWNFSADYAEF